MKTLPFLLLICLAVFLPSTSLASNDTSTTEIPWWKENIVYSLTHSYKFDTWDKSLYTSFTVLQVTDFMQTNYIFEHPDKYRENFPVARWAHRNAGDFGVLGCFVVGNFLTYKIAKHLKPVPRKILWIIVNGIQIKSNRTNHRDGVKFSLKITINH